MSIHELLTIYQGLNSIGDKISHYKDKCKILKNIANGFNEVFDQCGDIDKIMEMGEDLVDISNLTMDAKYQLHRAENFLDIKDMISEYQRKKDAIQKKKYNSDCYLLKP